MKKLNLFFWCAVSCVLAETSALFSIQFLNLVKNENIRGILSYAVAACFWLGIISEIIFLCIMNGQSKKIPDNTDRKFPIGIISFFKTTEGKIFDILSIIFLILVVMIIFMKISSRLLIISSLSAFFLSFQLRCFCNGRNYRKLKEYRNKKGEENI